MRFMFVAVVVVAGCAAPKAKSTGNRSGASLNAASPYSPDVRLWLEASEIGVDCPMGIADARMTRVATTHWRTESDHLLAQVACMCDVSDKDGKIGFDVACGYKPAPLAWKEPLSKDEGRMRAWENRLVGQLRTGVSTSRSPARTCATRAPTRIARRRGTIRRRARCRRASSRSSRRCGGSSATTASRTDRATSSGCA